MTVSHTACKVLAIFNPERMRPSHQKSGVPVKERRLASL